MLTMFYIKNISHCTILSLLETIQTVRIEITVDKITVSKMGHNEGLKQCNTRYESQLVLTT